MHCRKLSVINKQKLLVLCWRKQLSVIKPQDHCDSVRERTVDATEDMFLVIKTAFDNAFEKPFFSNYFSMRTENNMCAFGIEETVSKSHSRNKPYKTSQECFAIQTTITQSGLPQKKSRQTLSSHVRQRTPCLSQLSFLQALVDSKGIRRPKRRKNVDANHHFNGWNPNLRFARCLRKWKTESWRKWKNQQNLVSVDYFEWRG